MLPAVIPQDDHLVMDVVLSLAWTVRCIHGLVGSFSIRRMSISSTHLGRQVEVNVAAPPPLLSIDCASLFVVDDKLCTHELTERKTHSIRNITIA